MWRSLSGRQRKHVTGQQRDAMSTPVSNVPFSPGEMSHSGAPGPRWSVLMPGGSAGPSPFGIKAGICASGRNTRRAKPTSGESVRWNQTVVQRSGERVPRRKLLPGNLSKLWREAEAVKRRQHASHQSVSPTNTKRPPPRWGDGRLPVLPRLGSNQDSSDPEL